MVFYRLDDQINSSKMDLFPWSCGMCNSRQITIKLLMHHLDHQVIEGDLEGTYTPAG